MKSYNTSKENQTQGEIMLPSPLDMLDDIVVNEFSEKSALEFRNKVMKIAKLDPQRPIVVYIDSYGGSVYALGSMIAVMEEAPNPFITVAVGKAMSCGAMLLAAGDMRFADKNSEMLIHEISAGALGDVNDIKNDSENIIKLNKKWMDFLGEKCGKKDGYEYIKNLIKEQDGRNIYLDPKQAKEFGLVDYVGSPYIQPVVLYQISNSNKEDPVKERQEQEQEAPPSFLEALSKLAASEGGEVQVMSLSDLANDDLPPVIKKAIKGGKKPKKVPAKKKPVKKTPAKKKPAKKPVEKKKTTKKKTK